VFVIFHFLEESVCFFVFLWLWGGILGGFGDLWGPFLDFVEVPKNDRFVKSILDAKVDEESLRHQRVGGCGSLKEQ
jgi:hypothetical protein